MVFPPSCVTNSRDYFQKQQRLFPETAVTSWKGGKRTWCKRSIWICDVGEIKMLQKTFFLQQPLPLTLIHRQEIEGNRKIWKKVSHPTPVLESLRIYSAQKSISIFPGHSPHFFEPCLSSCPLDRHFSALNTFSTCELEFRTTLATPLTCLERCELQPPAHLHHCILGRSFEDWKEQLGAQREISRSWGHVANTETLRDIWSYSHREWRKNAGRLHIFNEVSC